MKAYLMNWRQEVFDWDFKNKSMNWSSGTNRSLSIGDFVFLIKLGKEPRGIVALGWVISETIIMKWNFKKTKGPGCCIKFLEKIKPSDKCHIEIALLKAKFPSVNWSSQNCISIPDDVFVALVQLWGLKKSERGIMQEISKLAAI